MWKLGLCVRNSFSGNICFQFSELVLCSAETVLSKVLIFSGVQYLKKAFLPLLVLAETKSHAKLERKVSLV
jgi:hypothetical protein